MGKTKEVTNETGFKLPTERSSPKDLNPRSLLLYGPPKVGKTTLVAGLDDALLVDVDKQGSSYVSALKVEVNNLEEFGKLIRALKAKPHNYTYGILDTVTILEDISKEYALILYRGTPMGAKFGLLPDGTYDKKDILTLANGAGYFWLRKAFFELIDMFDSCFERRIYIGHLKEKQIDEASNSVTAASVELTGKIKSLMCAACDSVGYVYRKGNETRLSFVTNEDIICGSRSPHLKNQDILVAEETEDGEYKTYWDKIYK